MQVLCAVASHFRSNVVGYLVAAAWQRRDHHVKRARGVAAVAAGLCEPSTEREQFQEAARPPARQEKWEGVLVLAAQMNEVQSCAVDVDDEVRQIVHRALMRSPVIAIAPAVHQATQRRFVRAELPATRGDRRGPARQRQPRVEVVERDIWDGDDEGLDHVAPTLPARSGFNRANRLPGKGQSPFARIELVHSDGKWWHGCGGRPIEG